MTDLQLKLRFRKSEKDDWTKVEDKALRKRIQNRLAKRKSRTNETKIRLNKKHDPARHSNESSPTLEDVAATNEGDTPESETSDATLNEPSMALVVDSAPLRDSSDNLMQFNFANPGLAEHRFIHLMEYSVLRAFIQNANILAIDPKFLMDDYALSPWTVSHPYPALTTLHDLSPTALQLATPHHPYLDMVALPSLRDNILLCAMTEEQEDQLCIDMHRDSFTIWGSQPWNAFAWEISQVFVTGWAWLVSDEMIRSSNFWRAERGEGPLVLPNWSGSILEEVV